MADSIPQPLTSFVGRTWELGELGELLRRHRLLTLVGAGGCGKSRLVLELAKRQVEFPLERVWFADLATVDSAAFVEAAIASAVDARPVDAEDVSTSLTRRISEAPGLLILDTCEHVIELCAPLVERLLHECPTLKVLATSRQQLRIPGELRWTVPSLTFPEADRKLVVPELEKLESVQLFVDRARLVVPAFELEPANADAVAAICTRLDGIPLAIELAAAWARVLTPAEIVRRLDERFALLRTGHGLNPRHQTLESAVQWSHDLLSEANRALLRRLSVFRGTFDIATCEIVCGDELLPRNDVVHRLAELVDQSMVEVMSGAARYQLLDTIRDYARPRLSQSGEADEFDRRHAMHFLDIADEAYRKLRGPGRLQWQNRLELEAANLRKALEWAQAHDQQTALRLAYLVAPFHMVRMRGGDVEQADAWLDRALSGSAADSAFRGWALTERGWLAWRQGKVSAAETHWRQALEAFRAAQDEKGIGEALSQLGEIAGAQGDLARSKRWLEEGLSHSERAGDAWMVAYARFYLGLLAIRRKQPASALEPLAQSLEIWRQVGDVLMTAYPTALLGLAALEMNELAPAGARFDEALAISRRHGYEWGNAALLQFFGALAVAVGDSNRAILLMSAAAAEFERIRSAPSPFLQPTIESWLHRARKTVPRLDAEALWTEGHRMTVDDAIELIGSMPRGREALPGGLSDREAQVAGLVARGFGSKQIASQLNISTRTADTHVDHIRVKLRLKSRAQIAAWAVENRLALPSSPD